MGGGSEWLYVCVRRVAEWEENHTVCVSVWWVGVGQREGECVFVCIGSVSSKGVDDCLWVCRGGDGGRLRMNIGRR